MPECNANVRNLLTEINENYTYFVVLSLKVDKHTQVSHLIQIA